MPKTKKLSYAKRRKQRNEARKVKINNSGNSRLDEILGIHSEQIIEIPDDSVYINKENILLENQERLRACILDIKQELDDQCINEFLKVLAKNTSFKPQDPLFYQGIHWYQQVNTNKDIQILYGGDIGAGLIGHWTCIYYDGSIVHVYDSLNRKLLPFQQEILKRLYREYSIIYEKVQIQPDGVSCGVFACAFAVTLAQRQSPTSVHYLVDDDGHFKSTRTMRQHLLKILDQEILIPFPAIESRKSLCSSQQQPSASSIVTKPEEIKPNMATQSKKTYASICEAVPNESSISIEVPSTSRISNCISLTDINHKISNRVELNRNLKKEWWKNYKDTINKNRRTNYATEHRTTERLSGKLKDNKTQKRANYTVNTDVPKYEKKAKYSANPKIEITYEKHRYAANPEIKKTREKQRYAANPKIKKDREKQKYAKNPEIKKAHEKRKYAVNPEIKKTIEKQKYTANPETKKSQERKKYSANPEIKKAYAKSKYAVLPETKKTASQIHYYTCKEKLTQKNHILKKYRNIGRRRNTITLLGSMEKYIDNLSSKINYKSKPQSRIEAEKIVKWCVQARKHLVLNVNKTLTNLKHRIAICVTRAAESTDIESKIAAICGIPKHTGSSEAYYVDTAYKELNVIIDPLITTTAGKIVNILPISKSKHVHKSWICSEMCVKPSSDTVKRLEHLLKAIGSWKLTNIRNNLNQLNVCSMNKSGLKLGHSQNCYTDTSSCKSKLLPLQVLQSHFPQIRYFMRQIYELMQLITKINNIDNALTRSDLTILKNL